MDILAQIGGEETGRRLSGPAVAAMADDGLSRTTELDWGSVWPELPRFSRGNALEPGNVWNNALLGWCETNRAAVLRGCPEEMKFLARHCGFAPFFALIRECGGVEIHIPKTLENARSGRFFQATRAIGCDAAEFLCATIGGGHVRVPNGARIISRFRDDVAHIATGCGLSANAIAERLDVHIRTVLRARERYRDAA